MFRVKRIYNAPAKRDGVRILVDRVWPRGIKKEDAALDDWLKDIAPSTELRRWFGHDPRKWSAFRERYARELRSREEAVQRLRRLGKRRTVTLLFGARDTEHNNAVALKAYLECGGK